MHLMDTAGQEDYAELRVLGHANTNCFIVSFSVADKVDFLKDLNFRSGIQTKVQFGYFDQSKTLFFPYLSLNPSSEALYKIKLSRNQNNLKV